MTISDTIRMVCGRCPERITLEAPAMRLIKVPLLQYVEKMAEQWGWQLTPEPRCPVHHTTCEAGR